MPDRRLWVALLLLGACKDTPEKELGLRHRSGDAGPAVVVVDKGAGTELPVSDEREPNEARTGGQPLAVPGAMRGRLDTPADWDVFQVKVPAAGTLGVKLAAVEGLDLVLEVHDEAGEVLVVSDGGGPASVEAIPNLFVQPSQYRLVVHQAPQKKAPRKPEIGIPMPPLPSATYLLEVTLGPVPTPGIEREMNDETGFADELALGSTGRGFLGWKNDVDLWKVQLAEVQDDESLHIDVDGVPEATLRVRILVGDGKAILERKGRQGEPVALRGLAARPGEPAYYIAVSADRSSEEPYGIRAQTVPREPDEEIEPNDAAASAIPLVATRTGDSGQRLGFLGRGDVDLYRLDPVPSARTLQLRVAPPSGVDVELAVLSGDGRAALAGPANAGKKGDAETLADVVVPANQAILVKVTAKSGESDVDRYRLGWSLSAGAPYVPEPE